MKKLLQTLTEALGPSGYEGEVREIVRHEVKSLADELRVDALGNLSACKHPIKPAKDIRKVVISAHMDEIGVMVSHVDKNGFVRFAPVGSVLRQYVPGSRIRFLNGTRGVMASDRLGNAGELPSLERMYLDVGAASRDHCPVKIGDIAVFDVPYMELGNRLVAKSMNNRVGILVAIETLRNLKSVPYEVTFAFTVQQQIGARGALTSAYAIDAEIGIALDVTPVDDMLHSHGTEIALGKGPCLKIQDAGMIADTRIVNWMIRAAEKKKIPYQREVLYSESTNAVAIQRVRAGVPSGCISVPVRYVHSSSEMVEASDVQNAVKLLTAVLHTQIEL